MKESVIISLINDALKDFKKIPTVEGYEEILSIYKYILSLENGNVRRNLTKSEIAKILEFKPEIQSLIERFSNLKSYL